MPSFRRSRSLLLLALGVVAGGCASSAAIEDSASSGDGGASGNGGASGEGGSSGDGGRSSSAGPGSNSAGVTSSSVTVGSSTSTSTSASSSAASGSSSASSASSSSASTTAAASSSSGGADPICDPLAPEIVCGAGQHCLPEPAGTDATCDVAGDVPAYGGCFDNTDCAPITECVDTTGSGGPLPCCLQYCTGDADCPQNFGTCMFNDPPLLADGVEYGVCYDDGGGCF